MAEERKTGPVFDPTKHRLGVTLPVARSKDMSIVEIHPTTCAQLELTPGQCVILKGRMRLHWHAYVMANSDMPERSVACADVVRRNLRVSEGDLVTVKSTDPKELATIELFPIKESIETAAPGSLVGFLQTFLTFNMPRLLGKENLFMVPGAGGTPYWFKVGKVSPKRGSDKFGKVVMKDISDPTTGEVINPKTVIRLGEPIPQKKGEKFITETGYSDIGGLEQQLQTIRENMELPLKFPKLFSAIGVKPPKGVLMHGPPGCGKTLIAKAIANELGCFYMLINGPEIISGKMGEAERQLRTTFEKAHENAPAIIVIDEIDAIAPNRDKVSPSDQGSRSIVATLLTCMDGLSQKTHIMVVGCTNRPNTLDPALRRSGRFDTDVPIPVPNEKGRREILDIFINRRGMKVKRRDKTKSAAENKDWVDIKLLARETQGYVGADLNALCKSAARHYLRRVSPGLVDFEESDVTPEFLQAMEITMVDFREAMAEIKPSCLKDVMIEMPSVSFDDIGGLDDVKRELREMVEFPVKYAKLFHDIHVLPPKGALLFGPPGCGKTLLAKAIAHECNANFIGVQGPQLKSKWIGSSEENVREYFDKARQSAPCVLFFDEMDSIASSRKGGGGPDDRVVNQLLTEMDGLNGRKQVFVIGATNFMENLDSAVMRTGRLDQFIYIGMPDEPAILDIVTKTLRKAHVKNVNLAKLAHDLADRDELDRLSGADVAGMCQRAIDFSIKLQIAAERRGEDTTEWALSHECLERAFNATHPSLSKTKQAEFLRIKEKHEEKKMARKEELSKLGDTFEIPEGDARLEGPPTFGLAYTEWKKKQDEEAEAKAKVDREGRARAEAGAPAGGDGGAGAGAGAGAR